MSNEKSNELLKEIDKLIREREELKWKISVLEMNASSFLGQLSIASNGGNKQGLALNFLSSLLHEIRELQ
jgi:hypothetical protein